MNSLFNTYKNIADKILPVLSDNDFTKTGMLTPSEFVSAGDYLVKKFHKWQWATKTSQSFSYLPKDKQFLILKDIHYKNMNNFILNENNGDDNDWDVYTDKNKKTTIIKVEKDTKIDKIEPTIDLDEFEMTDSDLSDEDIIQNNNYDDLKFYDITITYDNYYRTPRIWFHAHNVNGTLLTNDEILKDFSIEHTHVSVKIEKHPYYISLCVSVHPCKHAETMQKLIKIELENDKNIQVYQYFIYFFKFVSCILPNIIFDFTDST